MGSREWLIASGIDFCRLVDQVTPAQESQHALGVWNVRELVGHTSRALSTVENYLRLPVPVDRPVGVDEYYRTVLRTANSADVAERGRQAAQDLGADLAGAVRDLADRVTDLLASLPPDHRIATPFGAMQLDAYLETRAFELTVHSIDLASALDVPLPDDDVVEPALELAIRLRLRQGQGAVALLALTGRSVGDRLAFI